MGLPPPSSSLFSKRRGSSTPLLCALNVPQLSISAQGASPFPTQRFLACVLTPTRKIFTLLLVFLTTNPSCITRVFAGFTFPLLSAGQILGTNGCVSLSPHKFTIPISYGSIFNSFLCLFHTGNILHTVMTKSPTLSLPFSEYNKPNPFIVPLPILKNSPPFYYVSYSFWMTSPSFPSYPVACYASAPVLSAFPVLLYSPLRLFFGDSCKNEFACSPPCPCVRLKGSVLFFVNL